MTATRKAAPPENYGRPDDQGGVPSDQVDAELAAAPVSGLTAGGTPARARAREATADRPVGPTGGRTWRLGPGPPAAGPPVVRRGLAVHVALPAPSPMAAEFEAAGAILHVVPMRRISTSHGARAWLGYAFGVARERVPAVAAGPGPGADVLHSNSLHSWYGWAAAWLARRPHVWHAREIVVQSRRALQVERFLALHFATRRPGGLGLRSPSQLHPRNVIVVHEEATRQSSSPAGPGGLERALGLPDEALVVGYVGRIDTWKGVDVLLDSVPSLRRARAGRGRTARNSRRRRRRQEKKATPTP